METKAIAVAAFLFALVLLAGCVNRYEGCNGITDPTDPAYSCCVKPGDQMPDPNPNSRVCCPGTELTTTPPDTVAKCVYTLNSYWSSWQSIAILAVLISAFLTALAYMAGSLLSNQSLIAWAKNEFFQVMASAFLLGSLIGIIFMVQQGVAGEIQASGLMCIGQDCHILLADQYLQVMYDDAALMAKGVISVNSALLTIRSWWVTSELLVSPYYGSILMPAAGLGIPSQSLTNVLDVIMKVMMLIKAQQIALNLIEFALFPILLVMGLVLRTFFFTRKLGGLLLALAIGLYLVYPLVFVMAHNIWIQSIHKADRDTTSVSYTKNIGSYMLKSDLSNNVTYMLYPKLDPGEPSLDRLLKIRNNLSGVSSTIGTIVSGDFILGDGGYIEKASILLVYATVIPFIALMTTIGFVRGLSPILGGDVEIAGLTRIL